VFNVKITAVILFSFCMTNIAQATLRVYPTRLILNSGQKATTIMLRHEGDQDATYKISLRKYQFDVHGNAEQKKLDVSAQRRLNRLIRFSPRLVKLKPNQEQTIRILARTNALSQGETSMHLHFTTFEDKDAQSIQQSPTDSKVRTALKAHFAVAVPLIIRKGELEANYSIASAQLKTQDNPQYQNHVAVKLVRKGNRSINGNLKIIDSTTGSQLGIIKGVSLYNTERYVKIPVKRGAALKTAKLKVEFIESGDHKTISHEVIR
jgi:P pilus assembly chaperone PapD